MEVQADFCLQIEFEKNLKNPGRVFSAMSSLIEAVHTVDIDLANSIDIKIRPELLLQDIQTGSLKSFLRNQLEAIDDNDLKELDWQKIVGGFLHRAKYVMLDFLKEHDEITDRRQLESIRDTWLKLAEETEVRKFPSYAPLNLPTVIKDLKQLTSSISVLSDKDNVIYITDEGIIPFNKHFRIDSEKLEDLITKEKITNRPELILKVKKPDYLGESMWEFKHDKYSISAKILDTEWLKRFQNREFDIRPGDSIRALVEVEVKYGFANEVVATHHRIMEVKETIPLKDSRQSGLFE